MLQLKERLALVPLSRKVVAAIAACGLFFVFSLIACFSITWFIASEVAVRRERKRLEDSKEQIIAEWQKAIIKNGPVAPFPFVPIKNENKDEKLPDPIAHDKPAVINGYKFEIVTGAISKLKLINIFNGERETAKPYLHVRLKITNTKENHILHVINLHEDLSIQDEFGNKYERFWGPSLDDRLAQPKYISRIDPGQSFESIYAFEEPLPNARDFSLILRMSDHKIAAVWNIPRAALNLK